MNVAWILFIARRYFRSARKRKGLGPSALSVAGIAIGVLTLISVLGVMNGFQLGFIDDILAISSYHVRVTPRSGELTDPELARLRTLAGVASVVPFEETQTMITSGLSQFQAAIVRGVPPNVARLDPNFTRYLHLIAGSLYLGDDRSIVIGEELARSLSVGVGDVVSLVSLAGPSFGMLAPRTIAFTVGGVFRSGYYEFDQSLCFVSLSAAAALGANGLTYGVKLTNRFADGAAIARIHAALPGNGVAVESWRTYNRAFFGALRTEKLVMSLLLGLIFLVVAVNIYHFLKRAVYERQEEIGILRSTGASPWTVQAIFVFDGLYIGGAGGVIGLLLGLLIADHINAIFGIVETLINFVLLALGSILSPFASAGGSYAPFSPAYFYLDQIPSRVLSGEALAIFLFAVLSSVAAAYLASRHAARIKPQEVLRYE